MHKAQQKKDEKTLRDITIECIRSALTPHQLGCYEAKHGRLHTLDDKKLADVLNDLHAEDVQKRMVTSND